MSRTRSAQIQFARGTAAFWDSENPILHPGEPGFEKDTRKWKIGDGVTHWRELPYIAGAPGTTGPAGPSGAPGPSGPAGAPGQDFGRTVKIAGSIISGHRVVRPLSDGRLVYASAEESAHISGPFWLSIQSAVENDEFDVLMQGELTESSWNWTPTLPIFLGANGHLTQIPPALSELAFHVRLAVAESPTRIYFEAAQPISLLDEDDEDTTNDELGSYALGYGGGPGLGGYEDGFGGYELGGYEEGYGGPGELAGYTNGY